MANLNIISNNIWAIREFSRKETNAESNIPSPRVVPVEDTKADNPSKPIIPSDSKVKSYIEANYSSISYTVDEELKQIITKIKDDEGDTLRQYPPEDIIRVMKALKEHGMKILDMEG